MQTISSQHYIDDDIVAEKLAARDFEVQVSPVFEAGGVSDNVPKIPSIRSTSSDAMRALASSSALLGR